MNYSIQRKTKQSNQNALRSAGKVLKRSYAMDGKHAESIVASTFTTNHSIRVSQPGERCEHEADSVASQIVRGSHSWGRKQNSHSVSQKKVLSAQPSVIHETVQSPGEQIDTNTRQFMESGFGYDFSKVRVHKDSTAASSARALNANAFTFGNNIVFGAGKYQPHNDYGRQLLAHELVHTIQQTGEKSSESPGRRKTVVSNHSGLLIQRQPAGEETEKKPEQKDAGEVLVEGLKTVVKQARDNNPKLKKVVIDPLKKQLKSRWNQLGKGEKGVAIGFGAGALGMTAGALLSDPQGRKVLEGVNLAAPLTLIPYMPLASFKYTLPDGTSPEKRLFRFDTGFKADELINLYTEPRGLPRMSLSVEMRWGYDPVTDKLSIVGGSATLGIVPGLKISGGAYKDILRQPPTYIGPEGRMTQVMQTIPGAGKPKPIPDVRVMISIDLMKFRSGDLKKQIGAIFR